jgi:type IV pilus biogenesis protein CpaD/CtpE
MTMSRTRAIRVPPTLLLAALLLAAVPLAGCSQTDPYERAGIWKPSGVNEANIAAMVANPADLSRGRGDPGAGTRTATGAVSRMWEGPAKPAAAPGGIAALLSGAGTQQAPR